ncbi:MAG TPA: hypothetical protein VF491_10170 [Vicinamibacterales bacterium]
MQILFWAAGALVAGFWLVRSYWRVNSEIRRHVEGEAPLRSSRAVIWHPPAALTPADVQAGPRGADGAPVPPFHFIEEHDTGSQPCVSVRDSRERVWRAKWGQEVHTEVFGTRLAWALGFFAEPSYLVSAGTITGATDLRRAKACIDEHGAFSEARFELDEKGVTKHFDAHGWAWNDNPFVGSRELAGLKILMMLMSNWDNKDVRDVARGSNTAIFEAATEQGLEARYLIIDWGAALGAWGSNVLQRGRWDPDAFSAQNDQFITGVAGDLVEWGYQGQRTVDMVSHITVEDVRWFDRMARIITDNHLRAALRASGAAPAELELFTAALRGRLDRIRAVAAGPA